MQQIACQPEVRFPGFEEPWKVVRLGDIAEHRHEKNTDGRVHRVLTNSAEYGIVDQTAYFEGQIANSKNIDRYIIVEQFDFVYNPRVSSTAPVGPISVNKLGKGIMSPIYLAFHFVQEVESSFYEYFFQTESWHKYLRTKADTGARFDRLNISSSAFFDMPIPLPSLDEQQKIASCLSSTDDVIDETERKIMALKEHKKGLAQLVLYRKIDSGSQDSSSTADRPEEWCRKKLGDCAYMVKSTVNVRDYYGNVNYISTENMVSDFGGVHSFQSKPLSGCYCKYEIGDILISNIRPYLKKVWLATVTGICSNDIMVIRPVSSVLSEYLACVLKTDCFISVIMNSAQGVKMPRGDKSEIMKYSFEYPTSVDEQQKIASCLSSIDELITAYEEKLTLLKFHKKGLMQRLFPISIH